ncbi:E3 ubiquitin-protein ligase RNF8 isoform X2 [Pipistrellus kuhlii]|uniref:E3 ubiquitin-protein ligase RNF8 isoform X2 n=1 Tax=Pipistrellus kuhlii TaxID=59472 RepID=UPI00174F304B|nr:E3 ubiquitin-protein ligase RNF8 isoform X2 [Pipistrellus kuhlii]
MGDPGSRARRERPGGRSWCLRRVGMDAEWLLLEDGSEVTLGRGFGVTYQLVSKLCPLMISRNHCVLKQNTEGQWTIMDNKSLNGVWLNRVRLAPLEVYSLHMGDHVQLGVPLENKESAEYEYEVTEEDWEKLYPYLAPTNDQILGKNKGLRTKRKCSLDELEGPEAQGPSQLKFKMNKVSCEPGQPLKSHGKGEMASGPSEHLEPQVTSLEPRENTTGDHVLSGPTKVLVLHPSKQKAPNPSVSQSRLQLFKVTMSRILKLKTQMQEKQIAVLNEKKTQKGDSKNIVQMEQELQDLQSQLCAEQAQQQARVEQLEKTFEEEQQDLQGLEKEQGEENLKQQLAQALQEHQALMEELNRSKKDFEAIIQAKNKELEQTKEEKEKVQAQKEEVLSHMNDVLENELQCIICSEYFIEQRDCCEDRAAGACERLWSTGWSRGSSVDSRLRRARAWGSHVGRSPIGSCPSRASHAGQPAAPSLERPVPTARGSRRRADSASVRVEWLCSSVCSSKSVVVLLLFWCLC